MSPFLKGWLKRGGLHHDTQKQAGRRHFYHLCRTLTPGVEARGCKKMKGKLTVLEGEGEKAFSSGSGWKKKLPHRDVFALSSGKGDGRGGLAQRDAKGLKEGRKIAIEKTKQRRGEERKKENLILRNNLAHLRPVDPPTTITEEQYPLEESGKKEGVGKENPPSYRGLV